MCGPRQLLCQRGQRCREVGRPERLCRSDCCLPFGAWRRCSAGPETEAGHGVLSCGRLFSIPFLLSFPDVPFTPPAPHSFPIYLFFWKADSFPWFLKRKKVRSLLPSAPSPSCRQPQWLGSGGYFQRYFMQIQANTNLKILFFSLFNASGSTRHTLFWTCVLVF